MSKHPYGDQTSLLHQDSKGRHKLKDLSGKSRQLDTICLNQSQLKHLHAIRPYSSKERKSSRRESKEHLLPHNLSRSNSRRFDGSAKKHDEMSVIGGKQLSEMYSELVSLKSEYKMLKNNYNRLNNQKNQSKIQFDNQKSALLSQLQSVNSDLARQKRVTAGMEQQLQRIKKQCIKIIEMERFKAKKLEQTIQQKELMIAFLRNQLARTKQNDQANPLNFIQSSLPINFDYFTKQDNMSVLSQIPHEIQSGRKPHHIANVEEDSLSFSRDKLKESDSIINSFLSQDQSLLQHNFYKKDGNRVQSLDASPITQDIDVINQNSQKSQKSSEHPQFSYQNGKITKDQQQTAQKQFESFNPTTSKGRINTKRLHISINDENFDCGNLIEELPVEIRKKGVGVGVNCRTKKKLQVKKPKS